MTLAPFGRRRATIIARRELGAYVVLAVADDGPRPQAGQFYMLATRAHWGGGWHERPFLPRAFSALGASPGALEFLLEDVGPGTERLAAAQPGEDLLLTGPLGRGFNPPAGDVLLIGGGVGIAPLALAQVENQSATAVLGFKDAAHAAGAALLTEPLIATDDGSVGAHALVTELAGPLVRSPVTVFACGPPAMLEAVRALCATRGVAAQLALESPMACGYGACFGCVVHTREGYGRVCVDGPVFDAEHLLAIA